MAGKQIAQQQVNLYMKFRKEGLSQMGSTAKAGMLERSGRRLEHNQLHPKKDKPAIEKRDERILHLVFVKGNSVAVVAEKHNLSVKCVHQILRRMCKKNNPQKYYSYENPASCPPSMKHLKKDAQYFTEKHALDVNAKTQLCFLASLSTRTINCLINESILTPAELIAWYRDILTHFIAGESLIQECKMIHVPGLALKKIFAIQARIIKRTALL